jgi:hypothetical protein
MTEECTTCLGPHTEEIHAATVSVRRWFRQQVTLGIQAPSTIRQKTGGLPGVAINLMPRKKEPK